MLCERCQKNEATMTLTKTVNNKKTVTHLCPECAREVGAPISNAIEGFGNMLSGLMGLGTLWSQPKSVKEVKHCPNCGMTADEIIDTGKLGCAECYITFIDEMRPLLRKIHGNCVHRGTVPGSDSARPLTLKSDDERTGKIVSPDSNELETLKIQMQDAIAREDFESAAALRDRIKTIQENNEKEGR